MTKSEFTRWKRNGNFTISQKRILDVTNDIAENIHSTYTKKEAAECVMYWSLLEARIESELNNLKTSNLIKSVKAQLDKFEKSSKKSIKQDKRKAV